MSSARAGWLGALIVVASAALFGSLGVLARFAYADGIAPLSFVAWRAGAGTLGLWIAIVVAAALGRRRPPAGDLAEPAQRPDRSAWRWLAIAVLLGAGVNFSTFLAFDLTTVALALLGFYTYPAMVAAGSALLGRERLDGPRVLALALALGGMVAVVLGAPDGGSPDPAAEALGRAGWAGIGLALSAALFQTGFVLTSRGFAAVPAERAMGAVLLGTTVLGIVASLLLDGPTALARPLESASRLAFVAFTGVFAAALPSVLFLTGIRWIGGVRTGILMLIEPVVGVTLAAIFLREALGPIQVAGGATILLAAVIVQRGAPRTPAASTVAPVPGGP